MIIVIKTTGNQVTYQINDGDKKPTNDELCRAITHLEIIKQELLKRIDYDFEVVKEE